MDNSIRYVGLDVHRDSITAVVLDGPGKVVKQTVMETKSAVVLEWLKELRGTQHVVLEEGTWSAWLYELLQGRVARVVVCDARKITRTGNKSDRLDARELADLLRCNRISAVFHQDTGLRSLRELARTYAVLTKEQTRTMNRIKALYRGWAIPCSGQSCYGAKQRNSWLEKLPYAAVRERAKIYYQQLESVQELRRKVRQPMLAQARKHPAYRNLVNIPQIGPVRAALLMAFIQVPERFRSKRQFWAYCGFALETQSSGDYCWVEGKRQRSKKAPLVRGLNRNHHPGLKWIFKSAATRLCSGEGPFGQFHRALLEQGIRPEMARLTVARKLAAITLAVWKKGEGFDAQRLTIQAA
jgi:transposase